MEPNSDINQSQPDISPSPSPATPPTPPISTVIPASKPKRNVLMLVVGGIVILGVIIALGVGFILWKYSSKALTSPPPASFACQCPDKTVCPKNDVGLCPEKLPTSFDSTTNWKTYTRKSLGFSFRYPSDWTYSESIPLQSVSFNTGIPSWAKMSNGGDQVYVFETLFENQVNYENWSKQSNYLGQETIGGVPFEKYIVADMYYSLNYIYKARGGKIIRFLVFPYDANQYSETLKQEVNQILSTFKFLDVTGKSCQIDADCGSEYTCMVVAGTVRVDENGKEITQPKTCYSKDAPLPQ